MSVSAGDMPAIGSSPTRKQRFLNRLSIACAGSALICDGYQNTLMTSINLIFKQEYPKQYDSGFTTRMSNAMIVGQIIGMLAMGLMCDLISRKRAIVFTTFCMLLGSILATAAHGTTVHGMFWMIIVMRGVTGFGVGGEFPTSSAITLEAANENERLGKNVDGTRKRKKSRGALFTLIVNVPLQLGGPLNMCFFLIVWEACGGRGEHLSTVWRVMFGIGCVLPVIVFLMRLRLVNSQLFVDGKFLNYNIPWLLAFRFYWKRLLGTCITFFLYDMIVFPNGIFSSLILKSVVKGGDTKKTAEWNLLLGALTLPGVFIGAFLCDRIGRKRTLLIGFLGFVVFGIVIGAAFDHLKSIVPLFVVFYGLFQAVGHMGPGSMLGLITSESYATGVRATFYGLSLAFGRAGGAVGTQVFNPIKEHWGQRWTFFFSAIIGAAAIIWSWLFLPHLDGRELSLEDERLLKYLRSHGYEGEVGFIEVSDPGSESSREASLAGDGRESVKSRESLKTPLVMAAPTSAPGSVAGPEKDDSMGHRPMKQDYLSSESNVCSDVDPRDKGPRTLWERVFSLDPLAI